MQHGRSSPRPSGGAGGRVNPEIGSTAWHKHRQTSLHRDLESVKKVALKYPLDWNDEGSVLIQSAANGLENCTVERRDGPQHLLSGATATAALGFYTASKGCALDSTSRKVQFAIITRHAEGGENSSRQSSSSECSSDSSFPLAAKQRLLRPLEVRAENEPHEASSRPAACEVLSSPAGSPDSRSSLYIRPALRRGIKPYGQQEKANTSLGSSITSFIKGTFAHEDKWAALQDYQQDQSRHSILSDSISIISGADTVMAGFKTPDVSEHGYEWSLHGVPSHKCSQTKSINALQDELLTVLRDRVQTGHVKLVSGALPRRRDEQAKWSGRVGWLVRKLPLPTSWNCFRPAVP